MALEHSRTPASSGSTPFRPDLAPQAHEDIVALAESVKANADGPYQGLSVLLTLLRKMELTDTVPVWGLVSLMDPLLAQLDLVCADATTLNHLLVSGDAS